MYFGLDGVGLANDPNVFRPGEYQEIPARLEGAWHQEQPSVQGGLF